MWCGSGSSRPLSRPLRARQITEPPAGHRVGFAEAVDGDREVVGFLRERRDAHVFRIVVDELLVDFVGQNVNVFSAATSTIACNSSRV